MFILSDNHYTSIKKALISNMESKDNNYELTDIIQFIDSELSPKEKRSQVIDYIDTLHLMNIECWNTKYNKKEPMTINEGASKPTKLNDAQLYTSLTSLDYQLEEEYIELEDEANKYNALLFLRLLRGNVCEAYMCKSTSYANAGTWSIP